MICSNCIHESYCDMAQFGQREPPITTCYKFKEKQQTNADRVRSMTNEELAHLLHSAEEHLFTGNLWNYEKWMDWLKQEVKSNE